MRSSSGRGRPASARSAGRACRRRRRRRVLRSLLLEDFVGFSVVVTPRPHARSSPRPRRGTANARAGRTRSRGDRVQLGARDHHRASPPQSVRVGLHVGTVDDGDGTATDHLHRLVRVHDCAGVLVEAEADQRRGLGDRGEQPPGAARCSAATTIVPSTRPSPAAVCTCPWRGVAPGCPNAIMCTGAGPAEVPAITAPGRERGRPWCSRVPATIEVRRSWFPPARNTPVAGGELSGGVGLVGLRNAPGDGVR